VLELTLVPHIRRLSIQAEAMEEYMREVHEQNKQYIIDNNAKFKA
jgi:hypothetical protein